MAPATAVVGGFKRILVRLEADTRRRYCSGALAEELQGVETQLVACVDALKQAKQVEDATKQIEVAAPDHKARVASPTVQVLLRELGEIQEKFQRSFEALQAPQESGNSESDEDKSKTPPSKSTDLLTERHKIKAQAKLRQLEAELENQDSKNLEPAKELLAQFLAQLPPDSEHLIKKFWSRLVSKAVKPFRKAVLAATKPKRKLLVWLIDELKTTGVSRPYVLETCSKLEGETTTKLTELDEQQAARKEKRASRRESVELPLAVVKRKKRRLSEADDAAGKSSTSTGGGKRMPIHEVRAELARCERETKQASDKFVLEAYDGTLKRLVDLVGSLSSEFLYNDVMSLTVSLFAMVEQVAKLTDAARRRDRLVCLEGLLKVLLVADVALSTRRKTMASEYLQNCQQSIQLLDRSASSKEKHPYSAAPKKKAKAAGKIHLRFDD